MGGNEDAITDVRSAAEAVSSADDEVPVHQIESLCMRCGENVKFSCKPPLLPFPAFYSLFTVGNDV